MNRLLVILCVSVISGCGSPTDPVIGAIEIEPPPVYEIYWSSIESCSGQTADFNRVRWFVRYQLPDDRDVVGQRTNRNEIVLRSDLWLDQLVVSHEILHQILDGDGDHDSEHWAKCGVKLSDVLQLGGR